MCTGTLSVHFWHTVQAHRPLSWRAVRQMQKSGSDTVRPLQQRQGWQAITSRSCLTITGPDTRYSGPVKVAQTITSALGTGGNNTPLAVHGEPYCIAGNVINRQDKNGGNGCGYQQGVSYTLTTEDRHCVAYTDDLQRKKRVRKLIPLECERLMGFPDHWTDIPGASDSVRYRALGNSVAVPCVEYILCGIAYFLERQEGERDVHIPG